MAGVCSTPTGQTSASCLLAFSHDELILALAMKGDKGPSPRDSRGQKPRTLGAKDCIDCQGLYHTFLI